jgi:WD40 repeat protein
VFSVAVSRDGKWFVSAQGGLLSIWDLETGQLKRTLKSLALGVAISADGERIVSAGPSGLTFWDVETGLEKLTFPDSPGMASVALSDHGRIVTVGLDPTAKVWDCPTD